MVAYPLLAQWVGWVEKGQGNIKTDGGDRDIGPETEAGIEGDGLQYFFWIEMGNRCSTLVTSIISPTPKG